jgi:hypothetical protein
VLEDRCNREREALETKESMVGEASGALARRKDYLSQREATLQERMDRMLNQRQISLEQDTEQKWLKNYETIRTEFHAKTDVALERYK